MQKRRLGWTNLELTTIGLGTWAAGGGNWKFGWGPQDDNDTIASIHEAIDSGINWIDTAAVYGIGHSEEIVGKAIKGKREKLIIATKCERRWNKDGSEIYGNLKKESIKQECEDSLRRLGIDVIDLYQIHWPQPEEDVLEGWSAMQELVKEGKIRYTGVSNFSSEYLEWIEHIARPASLQPPFSMLKRGIETDQLAFCNDRNIGVICYSPMERGFLTGKVTKEWVAALPDTDHRKKDGRFNEPEFSKNIAIIDKLKVIASDAGITLSQLAIAWVLAKPGVTAAIVGARKPGQILETVKAGDVVLSEEVLIRVEEALK
jgi:aryl-alcohol dehydrogenase-like predicted oxidoreductase